MRRRLFACLALVAGVSLVASAGAAAAPDRGVTYGGLTSAHDPIVFKLSRDGKHVVKAIKVWEAPCKGGGSLRIGSTATMRLGVDRQGDFAASSSRGVTLEGGTWFLDQHFKGRVRGHSLSGSWKVDLRRYDATGTLADRCATSFTFKARSAKGRVYGGATSQDLPVLLRVTPREVRHIDFAWETDCRSGVFLQPTERVSHFPIAHGRFGDAFGQSDSDSGEKLRLDYTVHGTLRPARSAGRLSVRFSVRDGNDNHLIDDCNSGALAYKATSG